MNWLDYVLLFIIILNFYNGLRQGLLRQVARLGSFFIALFAAMFWYGDVKGYLLNNLKLNEVVATISQGGETTQWLAGVLANIISFLIIFFIFSVALGFLVNKLNIFNRIPIMGPLNAFLGGITGALKGILAVFLVAALISLLEINFWMKAVEASAVISLSRHYLPLLFGLIFDFVVGKLGRLI